MAITDMPTPSNPKSPEPEQQPLRPGQTSSTNPRSAPPERANIKTPESSGRSWKGEKK